MTEAIAALRQRFTVPSADLLQQHPLCGICWNDYDGEDQPVKLPCGHVFGEECVIAWAKGATPTGRHNGCPSCRSELLPPSLYSRASALSNELSGIWLCFKDLLGGQRGVALVVGLKIANIGAGYFPESQVGACVRRGSLMIRLGFMVHRFAGEPGWPRVILNIAALLFLMDCMIWLWLIVYS